jgi:hypothetical protein
MASAKKQLNPFKQVIQQSGQSRETAASPVPPDAEKTGRRSRESYTQVGAYIPKALYKDVQRRLIDQDRNFSEVVEELLTSYVAK